MGKPELRIGASGWNYSDWRGVFYPEDLRSKDYHHVKSFLADGKSVYIYFNNYFLGYGIENAKTLPGLPPAEACPTRASQIRTVNPESGRLPFQLTAWLQQVSLTGDWNSRCRGFRGNYA